MLWCGRARRFIEVRQLEKADHDTRVVRGFRHSFVFIICKGYGMRCVVYKRCKKSLLMFITTFRFETVYSLLWVKFNFSDHPSLVQK